MARYDKYDSKVSGTRAFLANDWLPTDLDKVVGVGFNARGQVVKGGGQTGIVGVLVLTRAIKAGQEPVDIMKRGEIVNFDVEGKPLAVKDPAVAPGTKYYAAADGAVTATATEGGVYVGHTVEASRLIVTVEEA